MARDETLTERIESVLHACAVPHSGKIAAVVVEAFAEEQLNARGELTLAHALLGVGTEREVTNARHRVQHALDALGGPWPEPKLYDGAVRKP